MTVNHSARRILAVASMTGAAEAQFPAILAMRQQEHIVQVISYAGATAKFREFGIEPVRVVETSREATRVGTIRSMVQEFHPHVIFAGTNYQDRQHLLTLDQVAYHVGRQMGVPVASLLDTWGGYLERHSRLGGSRYEVIVPRTHLPNAIIVMDEYARDEMLKNGFDPRMVHALGNPYFEHVMRKVDTFDGSTIDRMFRMPVFSEFDKTAPVVLILSDEMDGRYAHIGYDETRALQSDLRAVQLVALARKQNLNTLVRPHPFRQGVAKEVAEAMRLEVPNLNLVIHHPVSDNNPDNKYSMEGVLFLVQATGGAVVGTFNSPMVTAVCMRGNGYLPVISHQPNLNPDHPNMQAFTDDRGITTPTRDTDELVGALDMALNGELVQKPMGFIHGAIQRVVDFVIELAGGKQDGNEVTASHIKML